MAKAGRPRKPEGTQQGHYKNDAIEVAPLDDLSLDVPSPADAWLDWTKEKWDSYWRSPVARAAIEVDLGAITRLFTYYDEWAIALEKYQEERTTIGSQDQLVLHPMGKQMATLEKMIRALEDELGMTPLARQRLGIAIGQAKLTADDLKRRALGEDSPANDDDLQVLEAEWEEAG